MSEEDHKKNNLKNILKEYLFEGDKNSVKIYEFFIIFLTIISVLAIILETIESINLKYSGLLLNLEWFFTIFFSIEFLLRIYCADKKIKYIFSWNGFIDIIAIIPLYLSLIFSGTDKFEILRIFRILRALSRIFKVTTTIDKTAISLKTFKQFLGENESMQLFLRTSRRKYFINYFLIIIFSICSFIGIYESSSIEINLFSIPIIKVFSYIILVLCIFYLIKYEIIITNQRYAITNHRVFSSIGIFEENFKSTSYKYITDITLTQNFTQKILNIGTIEIKTTGSEQGNLKFEDIANPLNIKKKIHDNINYN